MAVDEMLMHRAAATGIPQLRFYAWSQPTVSLGYFQSAASREEHPPSAACDAVRRLTGGGAIVHDREITYSIALPRTDAELRKTHWLYVAMHDCLIELLAEQQIVAERSETQASAGAPPYLCFLRRTEGDVLVGEHKIAGSAQRRYRDPDNQTNAILQHGSLLLQTSAHAPELPGLCEITETHLNSDALVDGWSTKIARHLGVQHEQTPLTDNECAKAQLIERDRFANPTWLSKR